MPAKKVGRQQVKKGQRNRSARTETRTIVARALRSVDTEDPVVAKVAVAQAMSVMDRAVQKGILHKNNVARRKSRIAARLNRASEAR